MLNDICDTWCSGEDWRSLSKWKVGGGPAFSDALFCLFFIVLSLSKKQSSTCIWITQENSLLGLNLLVYIPGPCLHCSSFGWSVSLPLFWHGRQHLCLCFYRKKLEIVLCFVLRPNLLILSLDFCTKKCCFDHIYLYFGVSHGLDTWCILDTWGIYGSHIDVQMKFVVKLC